MIHIYHTLLKKNIKTLCSGYLPGGFKVVIEVEVVGFSYRMSKNYYKEFVKAVKNPD